MRAVLVLAMLARTAAAAPPSGYACAPGTAKKGVGCACPDGYAEVRDDDNLAMCAESRPKPPPGDEELARRECPAVEGALVKAYGAGLAGEEQKAFKGKFGATAVKRCTRAVWHKEGRKCLAAAVTAEAAFECIERLPPVERTGLEADAARAYPVGAELKKSEITARGPIVFATTTETMSEASRPQVNEVAKVLLANATARCEVTVYSDNAGDPKASEKLSLARANTLRDALIAAGVPATRVTAKGMGHALPIASNDSAWGRARNRRVQFVVVVDAPVVIDKSSLSSQRVLFDPASAKIPPAGKPVIDAVIELMKREPTLGVRIVGSGDITEGRGVDGLARQRATEVAAVIAAAGIARTRVEVLGIGATNPVAESQTAAGRARNRYVEFRPIERK